MKRDIAVEYKCGDGSVVSIFKIGSSSVAEIDSSRFKDSLVEVSTIKREIVKKITKQDRVDRIKALVLKKFSRTQVKEQMYLESYYLNNPNPASAFAGDWNSTYS